MLFLPKDEALADLAKKVIEDVVEKEGHCHVVGWRDVPVVHEVVGRMARDAEPRIVQVRSSRAGAQMCLSSQCCACGRQVLRARVCVLLSSHLSSGTQVLLAAVHGLQGCEAGDGVC